MRNAFSFFCFCVLLFLPVSAEARILTVDSQNSEMYSTIQQAIEAAEPGDTVFLTKQEQPYYESIVFQNKKGTVEKPITLDGNGAVLNGSEPLKAEEWQQVSSNLYRSVEFPKRLRISASILGRYFFIIDGKMNRMSRSSKGVRTPFKKVSELLENEWTYDEAEKAFLIRLPENGSISSVRAPERASGVALRGDNENIVVKNITSTHVWNDGFNIHGRSRNILFADIKAIECGDDGVSAHGDCHIEVDGLLSRGNSTGFCHVDQSESINRNIVLEQNHGHAIYLVNRSKHQIENGIVRSLKRHALRLTSGTSLSIKNVAFYAENPHEHGWTIQGESTLEAENCSLFGLPIDVKDAQVTLKNSLIEGKETAVTIEQKAQWISERNVWNIALLQWKGEKYFGASFSKYVEDSQQDQKSFFVQNKSE